MFTPVKDNTVVAIHDELGDEHFLGTLSFGVTSLKLYDVPSYASLENGATIESGVGIGDIGCTYIKVFQNNTKTLLNGDIIITTEADEHYYTFVESVDAKSEYAVKQLNPELKRCIILYYQKSNGLGFSNEYEALIYKEVQ